MCGKDLVCLFLKTSAPTRSVPKETTTTSTQSNSEQSCPSVLTSESLAGSSDLCLSEQILLNHQ